MLDQYAVQSSVLNTPSFLLSEEHPPSPAEVSCSNPAGELMDLIIPNIPCTRAEHLRRGSRFSLHASYIGFYSVG